LGVRGPWGSDVATEYFIFRSLPGPFLTMADERRLAAQNHRAKASKYEAIGYHRLRDERLAKAARAGKFADELEIPRSPSSPHGF
jgi:hypothetical protein